MAYVQRGMPLPPSFAALLVPSSERHPDGKPTSEQCSDSASPMPAETENAGEGRVQSGGGNEGLADRMGRISLSNGNSTPEGLSGISVGGDDPCCHCVGEQCDGDGHQTNGMDEEGGIESPESLPWWRVSDSQVKSVPWSTVAACEAYILVYMLTRV